jgi:hypothetical protein
VLEIIESNEDVGKACNSKSFPSFVTLKVTSIRRTFIANQVRIYKNNFSKRSVNYTVQLMLEENTIKRFRFDEIRVGNRSGS